MTEKFAARELRFALTFQGDLDRPVPSKKIFRFCRRANQFYQFAHLIPEEGRIAIVTNAGWDVVDATASARNGVAGRVSRERSTGAQTNDAVSAFAKASADGYQTRRSLLAKTGRVRQSRVVLAPVAGVKSAEASRPDRVRQNLNPLTTVTRRIRRRGEREISRKTIAWGKPVESV